MSLESITERLTIYYQAKVSVANSRAQEVGWKNDRAQLVRFEQLARMLPTTGFSLNDFGCGLGGFVSFLYNQGYRDFCYHGYDMLPEMVTRARQNYLQDPQVQFSQIARAGDMEAADFTVASGVFNIRFELSDEVWQQFIYDTLHAFDCKSRIGFAYNALTKYSDPDHMRPELYYSDPLAQFDYCKRYFSRNVALLHDYQEYDFTLLVRK